MAAARFKDEMDVRRYCDTVYRELSDIKKKAFNIVCTLETTTAEEEARKVEYFDLFDLLDDIEEKLESLTKECPLQWKGTREEIESGKRKLGDAIDWWYG